MNDKAIRGILIAYLQATNQEVRIYQEKSIGASICDVMAVTDKLTGYEIKSDLDNYTRLEAQIKAYDRFFDENYLAASQSHSRSAEGKVPTHWGILCIHNDNITVIRRAQKNRSVSRRNQLAILWKEHLDKTIVRKTELQGVVQTPDNTYAERLAECEKEANELRQIISQKTDCA